jgi:hypothetical protein
MLLLIISVTILLHLLGLPWWMAIVFIFLLSLTGRQSPRRAFWTGGLAIFSAWLILIAWSRWVNGVRLPVRVAGVISLPHWTILLLLSCMIGGLAGALAGLTGRQLSAAIRPVNS